MLSALASAGGIGVIGALFLLGVLYERHRHSPAPIIYRVILSVEPTAMEATMSQTEPTDPTAPAEPDTEDEQERRERERTEREQRQA